MDADSVPAPARGAQALPSSPAVSRTEGPLAVAAADADEPERAGGFRRPPARVSGRGPGSGTAKPGDRMERDRALVVHALPSNASCNAWMSSLFIPSIAWVALVAATWSEEVIISWRARESICQDKPYLSLSHPHGPS